MNPTDTPNPAPAQTLGTGPSPTPDPGQNPAPLPGTGPVAKQKIVIVEDNAALADLYRTRMQLEGYDCLVANDGIAGLYLIQTEMPDLVLLDLMVPAIAGDEVLKRMRASDWGKNIKVIVMSNLNEQDAPAGLRDLGIEDYLVKMDTTDDELEKVVAGILRPGQTPPSPA